jgi:mono/diheme cytochrome c family protein
MSRRSTKDHARRTTALLALAAGAATLTLAAAQDAPFPIAAWSRTTAAVEDRGKPAERGAAVFNNWCNACHSRSPMNAPGTTSLKNKYQGGVPAALEDRKDLTVEFVKFYVRNGVAMMPRFRKTEVSDADLDAVATYLTRR